MILFQEQWFSNETRGRDNTIDNAYFAQMSRPNASGTSGGGGGASSEELDKLKSQVEQLQNTIDSLNTQIAESNSEIDDFKQQLSDSNTEVSNLKQQLTDSNTEMDKLKSQIADIESKEVHKELTLEEYNALSPDEKMKDIEYFIKE